METIQYTKETSAIDLGCLLDAGADAIVILTSGETRLAAHRSVLVDRSTVFATMFGNDTLEASSGLVTVPDVEGPVLRQLLAYLYTRQAPHLPTMAPQLLAAADKYGVSGLKTACEQQLAAQMSVETAAVAAVTAVRHSCDSLKQVAIAYIKTHLVDVLATRGWADAVHNRPTDVVEVSRLVSETSTPTPADSGSSPHATSQPHSDDHNQTPASAAPPTAASRCSLPPDDAAVSQLWSLSAEEKELRLIRAAEKGKVGELEVLLADGVDAGTTGMSYCRWTALHYAAWTGNVDMARLLVAHGAAVDTRDRLQMTPLFMAAGGGHVAMVQLLLENSADHSIGDWAGWTPLHWAATRGNKEVAAALLEAGANRAATDEEGRTPLDFAFNSNKQQLVDLLTGT